MFLPMHSIVRLPNPGSRPRHAHVRAACRVLARIALVASFVAASVLHVAAIETRLPLYTLVAPKPAPNAQFGKSLAISEGGLLAVGSPEYQRASRAGVVRVYDLATGQLVRFLGNPGPYRDDDFGWSAAFVGINLFVSSSNDRGGLNLLRYNATTWELGAALTPLPHSRVDGEGGFVVARDGTDVLVYESARGAFVRSFPDLSGAPFDAPLAVGSGRVAIANRNAESVWVADLSGSPQFTLLDPDDARFGKFGTSLDVRGGRLLVGASGGGGSETDGVFLYDLASPGAPITVLGTGVSVGFGASVALTDAGEILVGAPSMQSAVGEEGLARLHAPTGEALIDFLPDRQASGFGAVVAAYGNRIIVSAPNGTADCCEGGGLVFVFKGSAPEPDPPPIANIDCGDLDGNGVVDSADLLMNLLGTNPSAR